MTVLEATQSGTHRDVLVAMRDLIARTIDDGCSPRDLVGLSRRLLDLAAEVRAIDLGASHLALVPAIDDPFDPAAI